jgi:undecaprenyl-diphosphatase
MRFGMLLLEIIILVILSVTVKLGLFNEINLHVHEALHANSYAIQLFSETASIYTFVAMILIAVFVDFARMRRISMFTQGFVIAIVVNTFLVYALKISLQIYRPDAMHINTFIEILNVEAFGYPSGHTARAFTLATYLSTKLRIKNVTILAFLWALGIALSRIILGVHWLSDVLGGVLVGILSAHITDSMLKHVTTVMQRMLLREPHR